MGRISEILEGWGNHVKDQFHVLNPQIKEISKQRLERCDTCRVRDGGICSPKRYDVHIQTGEITKGCGCPVAQKSLSLKSSCPLGKW
jgi:hypothetical protein